MQEFCVHERHGGICAKTGAYCNLGACPYEDLQKFAPVRHGRWLEDGTCSKCRCDIPVMEDKYCPNCGAMMDGKERR